MLDDSDIAAMREELEDSLPDTAVILAGTVVDDSGGGGSIGWRPVGTVPCRLSPISAATFGNERLIAERLAEDADWVVTMPANTAVSTDHRLEVGGRSFNVLAMTAPRSWELSRRVEVNEIV